MLGFVLPVCLFVAGVQEQPATAQPAPAIARQSDKHFRLQARRQPLVPMIRSLAAEAGVRLRVVNYLPHLVTVDAGSVTFEEGLAALCEAGGVASRKLEDGSWVVGNEGDLLVYVADPQDTRDVDIIHRCEYLSAESLANIITKAFPALRVFPGPNHLTPMVEGNNLAGAETTKTLGATEAAYKTHDVLISGPAGVVKRALALASKFDRPRKQVRINAKLTELSGSLDSTLGINWTFPSLTLQEIPDKDLTAPANSVKGLKFGSFAHSAAAIGAALQAREVAGTAKTLANPSITVVDGERSFILIGERRLFPKQTGFNSQGLPIFDVTEVRVGVYLQVAVQVGLDDDLTLTVFPQVSSVTDTVVINNSNYPIITTREAQTTVRLRSGEAIAIGGLLSEQDDATTTGIPLLSRIPVLGRLFGSKNKVKMRKELLVLVSPEILPESGSGGVSPAASSAEGTHPR